MEQNPSSYPFLSQPKSYVRNTQKETWPTRKAPSAPPPPDPPPPYPGPNHQHLLHSVMAFQKSLVCFQLICLPSSFSSFFFLNLSFLPSCPSPLPLISSFSSSTSFSSLLPSLPLSLSFSPSLPPLLSFFLRKKHQFN